MNKNFLTFEINNVSIFNTKIITVNVFINPILIMITNLRAIFPLVIYYLNEINCIKIEFESETRMRKLNVISMQYK